MMDDKDLFGRGGDKAVLMGSGLCLDSGAWRRDNSGVES